MLVAKQNLQAKKQNERMEGTPGPRIRAVRKLLERHNLTV